jgi:hypothetical protein
MSILIHNCAENKKLIEPLMDLYRNHQLFYLGPKEQVKALLNEINVVEVGFQDPVAAATVLERLLQEMAVITCDLKNTVLEGRRGTLLENITDDVFHQLILNRLDYPQENK